MAFIITNESLTFVKRGQTFCIASDHPFFSAVCAALKRGDSLAPLAVADPNTYLQQTSGGRFGSVGGVVALDGHTLPSDFGVKLIDICLKGLPLEPYIRLIEKILQNFSTTRQVHLFTALGLGMFPITYEGNIIAYSIVSANFLDYQYGKFLMQPGLPCSSTKGLELDELKNHLPTLSCMNAKNVCERFQSRPLAHIVEVEIDPRLVYNLSSSLNTVSAIAGFTLRTVTTLDLSRANAPLVFLAKKGEYRTPAVPNERTQALIQEGIVGFQEVVCN